MADVITRLKVDTSNYDAGLAKAKRGLDQFAQQNTTVNGVMAQGISMLTKFAGGFAAVQVAAKAFNAVIMEGSQTTGDFVRNGIGALNDTMGMLATSFATFDFSPFNNGLISVYNNAVKLREELDALNNMQMSLSFANSESNRDLAQATEVLRNPGSTAAEMAAAIEQGNKAMRELRENSTATAEQQKKVALETIEEWTGIKGITEDVVNEVFKIDLNKSSQKQRENLKTIASTKPSPNDPQYTRTVYNGIGGSVTQDTEAYQKDFDKWASTRTNAFAQVATTLLEKSDESYQSMMQTFISANDMLAEVDKRQTSWNHTVKMANRQTTSTTTTISNTSTNKAEATTSSLDMKSFDTNIFRDQTESLSSLRTNLAAYQKELMEVTNFTDFQRVTAEIEKLQSQIEAQPLALRLGIGTEQAADIQAQWNSLRESLMSDMQPLEIEVKTKKTGNLGKEGKEAAQGWEKAAASVSELGGALQSVDNKGVNIAGIIMQAVANVALGFASALKEPATTSAGVFGWIAAAVSGLATMTATIVSIKRVTSGSFAEGGIVPGTYNGGIDNTYIYASPGEVILNRAQQSNLLSQLDSVQAASQAATVVRGEQLLTVLNNYGRRKGYGEIAWA